MKDQKLKIRKMKRKEIDIVIDWAEMEGWNPGLHDAEAIYAADPDGFFVGFLKNDPIATISAIKYNGTLGFIGFHIIPPEHRGRGYSFQMFEYALEYLKNVNAGLDGIEGQNHRYELLGFEKAWDNIRFVGYGKGRPFEHSKHMMRLENVDFPMLLEYDQKTFGHDRREFLRRWIHQPEGLSLGWMSTDGILGYGVLRKCRVGYKIGPLYADDNQVAMYLFDRLVSTVPREERVYLDVPAINPIAVSMAKGAKMKIAFKTTRMYNRGLPEIDPRKWFGITCQELG